MMLNTTFFTGLFLLLSNFLPSQNTGFFKNTEKYYSNVVCIDAGENMGYGLITGQSEDSLYILTANHVIYDLENRSRIENIFINYYGVENSFRGVVKTTYRREQGDFAFLLCKKPKNFSWENECLGILSRDYIKVKVIGSDCQWVIPGHSATLRLPLNGTTIKIDDLNIEAGSSGIPVFNNTGFIGIIIESETNPDILLKFQTIKDIMYQESNGLHKVRFQLESFGEKGLLNETLETLFNSYRKDPSNQTIKEEILKICGTESTKIYGKDGPYTFPRQTLPEYLNRFKIVGLETDDLKIDSLVINQLDQIEKIYFKQ